MPVKIRQTILPVSKPGKRRIASCGKDRNRTLSPKNRMDKRLKKKDGNDDLAETDTEADKVVMDYLV